jgi:lysozyme family protein
MADRHTAFLFVMSHEDASLSGVVVTDDDGGKARFGVNSNDNPQAITDGFYDMPKDEALAYAENVFVARYWNPIACDEVTSQRIANQFSDLHYVSGGEAILIMQRAVNKRSAAPIAVDGKMGRITLNAINNCAASDEEGLLDAIKAQATVFYQILVRQNPAEYTPAVYASWMRRLNA